MLFINSKISPLYVNRIISLFFVWVHEWLDYFAAFAKHVLAFEEFLEVRLAVFHVVFFIVVNFEAILVFLLLKFKLIFQVDLICFINFWESFGFLKASLELIFAKLTQEIVCTSVRTNKFCFILFFKLLFLQ